MPLNKRQTLKFFGTCALLCTAASFATAATPYPVKPVRIVVPYAAGGPVDSLARALAASLSTLWGQQYFRRCGARKGGSQTFIHSPFCGHTIIILADSHMKVLRRLNHVREKFYTCSSPTAMAIGPT